MAIFDISLLAILYRDLRLWLIQVITLAFGIGAMIASMKLLHIHLNLLNVLSFRLVLAIGVDYGIYIVLIWQKTRDIEHDVAGVVKPVLLAGLTAISGFGSLALARNPALTGLGIACAIGIFWSLVATIFFTLPAMAATKPKPRHSAIVVKLCPYRAFRSTKALLNWQDNAPAEIAVVKRDFVHHSRFALGRRGC